MTSPIIVIPARMASTRLPRKPLADLAGKPMVVRVLEQGLKADLGPVVVACDDPLVAQVVQEAGGQVCLTDPALPSGSDRVYAALSQIDPDHRHDIVINLQGDSPMTDGAFLRTSVRALEEKSFDITTVAVKMTDRAMACAADVCKIALGGAETDFVRKALYFSRSPIPWGAETFYCHVGLYAYRREALKTFVESSPSLLEQIEKLEQLRALEAGLSIGVSLVDAFPQEINTPEDLEKLRKELSLKE